MSPAERPRILITETLATRPLQWLEARAVLVQCASDDADFPEHLRNADALIVRTYTTVDQSLLDRAPRLRIIGRAGVGLDNVDLEVCRVRKIPVVYTPDANTQAVVEYVFTLLLDHLRPHPSLAGPVDDATWRTLRAEHVGRHELRERTLGILGFGRIGSRVARVARAIGMNVRYNDLQRKPDADRVGAPFVELEELFSDSHIVTLHIDGRASNRSFVNDRLIGRMRPDAVLINTSRGMVVDHAALASFLNGHPEASALLDVHAPEPVVPENPLLTCPNATLFPHLASRTEAALENMSWVVRDVMAGLNGEPLQFPAGEGA